MLRRTFLAGAAAVMAVTVTAGPSSAQDEPLTVGFIYVGPHNDGGYSERHDVGRQDVEAYFGDRVRTVYAESVPEGPDAEQAIEQMVREGADIVFATSFGFMNATAAVAERYPDVKFEHATGYLRADNLATYNARFYEGRYVLGQIAAEMSEVGVAGYIGSFPIPEVIMGINAFMLGAQSVNPDFQVRIVWVNTWVDPAREADAANALFDQGVDVIAQHTDSPAALQVAEMRMLHGFGQSTDMIRFAPNAQYTSIVDNWGPYYIERVQEVLDGTWTSTDVWGGIADGFVEMAPYTNMPEDVAARAEATEQAIASGELQIFAGPIYDQTGALRIPEGEVISDPDLLGMNWYIQGIDDTLPQ